MDEYIAREAAIQIVCENPHNIAIKTVRTVAGIKAIPTADVVEVRHGEWLPDYEIFVDEPFDTTPYRTQTGWKCSLCGRVELAKEAYCHCGAKMDGKDE